MADTHVTSGFITVGSGLAAVGSGMSVNVINFPTTSISGNVVNISGQPVQTSISGQSVVIDPFILSGLSVQTSVSGNVVQTSLAVSTTVSGDGSRLRVSIEGQAPTYIVNSRNISLSTQGPMLALMNYGSGTANPVYKIKGLYITTDPVFAPNGNDLNTQSVRLDAIRMTNFSGGGTMISGTSVDTADPPYSGTLAAPGLQQACTGGGYQLDGVYISYITDNLPNAQGGLMGINGTSPHYPIIHYNRQENGLNLLTRVGDVKQVAIRSGYGFAVIQGSGFGYTQTSGSFSMSLVYSVEA